MNTHQLNFMLCLNKTKIFTGCIFIMQLRCKHVHEHTFARPFPINRWFIYVGINVIFLNNLLSIQRVDINFKLAINTISLSQDNSTLQNLKYLIICSCQVIRWFLKIWFIAIFLRVINHFVFSLDNIWNHSF